MLEQMRKIALGDDELRTAALRGMWGDRVTPEWVAYKVARWRAVSDPQAVAEYSTMFGKDGIPEPSVRVRVPVLAVTGELDAPPMRQDAVLQSLTPMCEKLTVIPLAQCGHYPMQEMPPLLVTTVERFLQRQ